MSHVCRVRVAKYNSNQGARRRISNATSNTVNELSPPDTLARNEIDSAAETSCAGANWIPLIYTGDTASVFGFNGKEHDRDIPFATCATKVIPKSGIPYILICPQMLYYGAQMPRSLLNPNQLRLAGTIVRDDPTTAREEDFGLITSNLYIPFQTAGSTVYFDSVAPTYQEVEDCPYQVIGPDEWNPQTVMMRDYPVHDTRAVEIAALNYNSPLPIRELCFDNQPVELYEDKSVSQVVLSSISTTLDESSFDKALLSKLVTEKRHSPITPEEVSQKFGIGLDTAKKTIQVTTQRGIRHAIHPLHRRYRTDHLDLHRRRLGGTWFMDTLIARYKSLLGNSYSHVITNGEFTQVYPVKTRTSPDATDALESFCEDVGIPETLWVDGAKEYVGQHTPFVKLCRKRRIDLHRTEPGKKNQNHAAEHEIGEVKRRWKDRKRKKRASSRLWDYGMVHEADLMCRYARGPDGRTGYERVTGNTPDISEYCDFEFNDLVWYRPHGKLTDADEPAELGLWMGISHRVGSDMSYWILPRSGIVGSYTTVQHVTKEDYANPAHRAAIDVFQTEINQRLNDDNFVLQTEYDSNYLYLDDEPEDPAYPLADGDPDYEDDLPEPEPDEEDETIDHYLHSELVIDNGDGPRFGRVVERARHPDGKKIGNPHRNPMFDTREYIVEFPDQSRERYMANTIAENLYSQVDDEGNQFRLLEEIVDHRTTDEALAGEDCFRTLKNGTKVPHKTTKGHEFQAKFKGGEHEWIPVKTLKDSDPIAAAEFAKAQGLDKLPAFSWWVDRVLDKTKAIISKVKSRYWKTTHKYGIKLPHSVEEAYKIDKDTNTDYWTKAIAKESAKVKVSYQSMPDITPEEVRDGKQLIGYQEIKCQMVFDVKMDFTRKARWVARGDMTEAPSSVTYSSVVSRDSVRLAFLIAGLNDLDILACDVSNAYLNAPCREKVWFVGGRDTGEDFGKVCVVKRALYGLKSSGASWRNMLSNTIQNDFGFEPTRADSDVYRRPAEKDGFEYYEYIFVYVDDLLILSKEPRQWIDRLKDIYELREDTIKPPDTYLGAMIGKTQLEDGREAWHMAADKYVENSVRVVQELLDSDGEGLTLKSAKVPFPSDYKPELDVTRELDAAGISRYRQLIGILRWAVELGRVDIYLEVSLLSQYLASPREGHMEAAYHIFAFLKGNPKQKIVFDFSEPYLDESQFANVDWTEQYGDVVEELPPGMPKPRGNSVIISCFVDSDHAGNKVTRRSHTGILIWVNNAPIIFYSKRQNTVETSTFGSELVAMRIAKELIVALKYKLRMFGVPIDGPANVYCDNQGVVKNTSLPESTLSKKHNAINYHTVREAVAAGIMRVAKEPTETNLADLFTKPLSRSRRNELLANIVYGSYFRVEWLEGSRKRPASALETIPEDDED